MWRWLDEVRVGNEVEATFQDAKGTDVASALTTRAMNFGEVACPKSALQVQVEFAGSRAMATLVAILDEEQPLVLRADFPTEPGRLLLNFTLPATLPGNRLKRRAFGAQHLPPFRSMQVLVTSPAGKLVVRGVAATAFANTLQVEE